METIVVMARDNRVRLNDDEVEAVDDAAAEMFGEGAIEDIPRGRVIGELAEHYTGGDGGDDE